MGVCQLCHYGQTEVIDLEVPTLAVCELPLPPTVSSFSYFKSTGENIVTYFKLGGLITTLLPTILGKLIPTAPTSS